MNHALYAAFQIDEVAIRTTIGHATPRMVRFDYEVQEAGSGRSLATGFSKHVFCGRDMKPRKLPQKYWPLFGIALPPSASPAAVL